MDVDDIVDVDEHKLGGRFLVKHFRLGGNSFNFNEALMNETPWRVESYGLHRSGLRGSKDRTRWPTRELASSSPDAQFTPPSKSSLLYGSKRYNVRRRTALNRVIERQFERFRTLVGPEPSRGVPPLAPGRHIAQI